MKQSPSFMNSLNNNSIKLITVHTLLALIFVSDQSQKVVKVTCLKKANKHYALRIPVLLRKFGK